jgi:hypothetical protein
MELNFNDLAKLTDKIAAEDQHRHPVERALESANTIRENLTKIKGENYARLVEMCVLVTKQTKLNAMLSSIAFDDNEHLMKHIGGINALLMSKMISHAANIMDPKFSEKEADELTEWADRITKAEQQGIEQELGHLIKGEDK